MDYPGLSTKHETEFTLEGPNIERTYQTETAFQAMP